MMTISYGVGNQELKVLFPPMDKSQALYISLISNYIHIIVCCLQIMFWNKQHCHV